MSNVSEVPTRIYNGIRIRAGSAVPYGAFPVPGGVNFSVNSNEATGCKLALFHLGDEEPFAVIPFFDDFRIGNVYSMTVFDIDPRSIEYGYIFDGPSDRRVGLMFDRSKTLIDPYAMLIAGREVWNGPKRPFRSRILVDDFDWQGDRPLENDMRDLIIYEMHVRGFTRHESSGVEHPGTYMGLVEKIPYLKELGINCVELMPVFEFDELENTIPGPNGEKLLNYWGYSTVSFFSPKAGYAVSGRDCGHVNEFKSMIRELHKNGIEVILDVVFNHTAEMGDNGPYISFRGIDNRTYYMLTPDGHYQNFSGCGNTMNCNHPVVRSMILDCLRYWTSKYHIDGFRFDLASILGRDQYGAPMNNPPLIEALAHDSVLGRTKLIAEAWDAGGLYQVGSFPSWGRWAEWNGKYRDDVRQFLKGDFGMAWRASEYLKGSHHMYNPRSRGKCASVNMITCHDGFTLMDLYSYSHKQNDANGEHGRDGANDNHSWDCVLPGDDEAATRTLRHRMVKNAIAFLMLSRSVPMMLAGDEFGNSQRGNNNAYCQDNDLSWIDWTDKEKNADIFAFAKRMIELRRECACLKSQLDDDDSASISFHGTMAGHADLSDGSTTLGVLFSGADGSHVYAAFNMHWEAHDFEIPHPPAWKRWEIWADTFDDTNAGKRPDPVITMKPRSVVVLKAV